MRRFLDSPTDVWLARVADDVTRLPMQPPVEAIDVAFAWMAADSATDRHDHFAAARLHAEHACWQLLLGDLDGAGRAIEPALDAVDLINARGHDPTDTSGSVLGLASEIALRFDAPDLALTHAQAWFQAETDRPRFDPVTWTRAGAWSAAIHGVNDHRIAVPVTTQLLSFDHAAPRLALSIAGVLVANDELDRGVHRIDGVVTMLQATAERAGPDNPTAWPTRPHWDTPDIELNRTLAALARDVEGHPGLDEVQQREVQQVRWIALAHAANGRWREIAHVACPQETIVPLECEFDGRRVTDASRHAITRLVDDVELAAVTLRAHGIAVPRREPWSPDTSYLAQPLVAPRLAFESTPAPWRSLPPPASRTTIETSNADLGLMASNRYQLHALADLARRGQTRPPPARGH